MLSWLKKFVLDIMPSVAATIIGAYIVNHYIVPKSPAAQQAAISATAEPKATDVKAADVRPAEAKGAELKGPSDIASDKSGFEKGVAEKAAIEKVVEKAAADKTESAKHHTATKLPNKPANEERRANELARAAIDRLRGTSSADSARIEPAKADSGKIDSVKPDLAKAESAKAESPKAESPKAESPKVEAAKSELAKSDARGQPVTTVVAVPPMQPLPPAITVAAPNPDVFEQGAAAPVVRQPFPQSASRNDDSQRLSPPADIPGRRPLDLRAEAVSSAPSDRTSVADDVVSAAKSMFHAVIPR